MTDENTCSTCRYFRQSMTGSQCYCDDLLSVHTEPGASCEQYETQKPSPYLRPGLYPALRITTCKTRDPYRAGDPKLAHLIRHKLYVVEFEIIKSEVLEHKVGESVMWIMRASISLAGFLAEVLQIPFSEAMVDEASRVFEGDDPLCGRFVRCEARERKAKSGRGFIYCKWVPIEVQR